MLVVFDYHIHSYYSYDSLNRPIDVLKTALKKNINALSITDHNTIKGSLELAKLAKDFPNILVVKGVELKTDRGDLIVLGLNEEIKSKNFYEVIDIAKSSGFLTILPHPYFRHRLDTDLLLSVDLIEAYNSRSPRYLNEKALKIAKRLGKAFTAGSDAHLLKEIGNGLNLFLVDSFNEEALLKSIKKGNIKTFFKPSNIFYRMSSAMIQVPKRFLRF